MRQIRKLIRLAHIGLIFSRHGVDRALLESQPYSSLRLLGLMNPFNWFGRKSFDRAVAIREAIEDLGPIFIKFAQALSTRRDLLAADIADELVKLQDNVPPFDGKKATKIIERTLGASINELFARFDVTPLASASIAQVHAAKLSTGEDVVVKIVRPDVERRIRRDVELLESLADLIERYWDDGKRLRAIENVQEFKKNILDELDLLREASNASQLKRNFADSKQLFIPEIYWPYTRRNIMVMERIYGIPITDMERLAEHSINLKRLAERGVEIFFTQVFRDSFFHADMHPGNIFVSTEDPDDPQYICVDFGIMGSLTVEDKRYLAENFHAFFQRDYRRVAILHIESGWVPFGTRVDEFEAAIRTVCEPIFERPLRDISCAAMLLRLFQTGRRFKMEIQPQLTLLQKTLFAIEGLGRQLYPDLDLWSTAKPFLAKWMKQRFSVKATLKRWQHALPYISAHAPELPSLIHDLVKRHHQMQLQQLHQANPQALPQPQQKPRSRFWLAIAIIFASIALADWLWQQPIAHQWLTRYSFASASIAVSVLAYLLYRIKSR